MAQYLLYLINLRKRGERGCVWEYEAVPPEPDQPEGQMVCLGFRGRSRTVITPRNVTSNLLRHYSNFRFRVPLRYIC